MYIVKVEQPGEGGIISAVDANGNPLPKSFDFDVAHEGEKVILKADLQSGWKIKAAYNDLGASRQKLSKDENGNYYIIVPKGGGVSLSAELEKEAPPAEEVKTVSGILLAKTVSKGSTSLVLSWNKVDGAEGYDVFLAKCGKKDSRTKGLKLVKTVKGSKTLKWTKKKLKKQTAYKAVVKAYVTENGSKKYVVTSPMIHAYTSGGTNKYTNAKSIKVKKKSVALKVGRTHRIRATVNLLKNGKKLMPKDHAASLRYLSSDAKIATVSKAGKITAKSKGSCKVFVYSVNGVSKTIKVTVK